jgi:predicted transcriptional regulator
VKIAISLPDDLFREIDARARALKLSRSAFLAKAARQLLASERPAAEATDAWNAAIDRGGQPADEAPAARAMRRTKAVVRASSTSGSKPR